MSNKVLRHPDKEDIIKKLLDGESVKEVERWLKSKHPKSKRLQVSYMTLQKFRSEHLNLRGDILDDIKNRRSEIEKDSKDAEVRSIVLSSSSYQQKIEEIASSELDVTKRLLEMDSLITSRIEYYYNLLSQGGTIREDKIFLEYINTLKSLMQDWKKYIEGFADKKIEHNINLNVIDEQARIIREAVYEVLQDMQPELIPVFVDKMELKMRQLNNNELDYIDGDIIDV
jgi:superfamily I DNA/RNA helicase